MPASAYSLSVGQGGNRGITVGFHATQLKLVELKYYTLALKTRPQGFTRHKA